MYKAANSHQQNDVYLARLEEAMASLGMNQPENLEQLPGMNAPSPDKSCKERSSRLMLLKDKLRRKSSEQDEAGINGLSHGVRSGSRGSSSSTKSEEGLNLEPKTRTLRRSTMEYDQNGRRLSRGSGESNSERNTKSDSQHRQPSFSQGSSAGRKTGAATKRTGLIERPKLYERGLLEDEESNLVGSRGCSKDGVRNESPSTSGQADLPGAYSHQHADVNDQRWRSGPIDPAGRVTKLSEQPLLCMSVLGKEAVVGSSDHALYCVDLDSGQKRRTLFGRTAGHTEWVTCVTHLPDGRILSGGMDSQLLLWPLNGVNHTKLQGHTASISAVRCSSDGSRAVSSSYDKTLRIWTLPSLEARSRTATFRGNVTCLQGHVAPVLDFAWASEAIVSGARDGGVILWDLAQAAASRRLPKAHLGHVTALTFLEDHSKPSEGHVSASCPNVFLTGGQDGYLRVWDSRSDRAAAEVALHVAKGGTGAVSSICATADAVVTAGADGRVCVLDSRASFRVRHTMDGPRGFIYALHVAGGTAFSGGGDGSLLVHDMQSGKTLYGLGAISNGAVRCIETTENKLVCAGDDGSLIVYGYL